MSLCCPGMDEGRAPAHRQQVFALGNPDIEQRFSFCCGAMPCCRGCAEIARGWLRRLSSSRVLAGAWCVPACTPSDPGEVYCGSRRVISAALALCIFAGACCANVRRGHDQRTTEPVCTSLRKWFAGVPRSTLRPVWPHHPVALVRVFSGARIYFCVSVRSRFRISHSLLGRVSQPSEAARAAVSVTVVDGKHGIRVDIART